MPKIKTIVKKPMSDHDYLPFGQMKRSWRNFGFFIVSLLLFSGFATYFILLNLTPLVPTKRIVTFVLIINILLIIVMLIILVAQFRRLALARTERIAAAQLHADLVKILSAIAAFPLILMAIFASFSVDQNLDHWFSQPIKSIVKSSLKVASKYVVEKGATLGVNSKVMAKEFSDTRNIVKTNPQKYAQLLEFLGPQHNIESAYLIDNLGNVITSYQNKEKIKYEFPNQTIFNLANSITPVVILPIHDDLPQTKDVIFSISQNNDGIIRSLIKLKKLSNVYLYTQSKLDSEITAYIAKTRENVIHYGHLQRRKGGYQVAFALMYIVVALTLLIAVIWVGLWFAGRFVDPIRRLIQAAKKISDGNLSAEVALSTERGELAELGSMFNKMTIKLRQQRDELTQASTMMNEKRRFTEAVLSGVSAGVIGLNYRHEITLINRSASHLLPGIELKSALNHKIETVLPQFSELMIQADEKDSKQITKNVNLVLGTDDRSFAVQVTREQTGEAIYGYVITFDDITQLLSAQKTAAWADVAQRIAHEIKNPLTPIQLSAERLKRKYSKKLDDGDDDRAFAKCTDTIVRHVGDIGRMVSEFSDFAKIADPIMEKHDLCDIVGDGVGLFQMSFESIDFQTDIPKKPLFALCDRGKLTQSVTNLVKNASEAIEGRKETEQDKEYRGKIKISLVADETNFTICIIDNGCGLPEEKRNTLFDPYVTTRVKGTGLGLAIVKKIIEQHHGVITLEDAKNCGGTDRGSCAKIVIPLIKPDEKNNNASDGLDSKPVRERSKYKRGELIG